VICQSEHYTELLHKLMPGTQWPVLFLGSHYLVSTEEKNNSVSWIFFCPSVVQYYFAMGSC